MTFPAGTKLGPYELQVLLGAGGMGQVYRARDTRLDRTVAVKVVRSGLTGDASLRSRFEREARAISQLSHPHICSLFDVGNHEGCEYLVMEYVEGETLADRIHRGPLPLSQVLRYGIQIGEALDHAHRLGIVHRDLKPGNIMLTSAGVKLLDFGLAKFVDRHPIFSDETAPLTARPLTAEGKIVGTLQYMSPEQLHGTMVDQRTDIFAFGIVLYEMVCGQRPFPATSSATLIAAIVSADPVPLRSVQPGASPVLERIILTALEKNPDDRWQSAQDVARQLRWLAESSSIDSSVHAVSAAPRRRWPLIAVPLAILAAAAIGTLAWRSWKPQVSSPALHLQLVPPDGLALSASPESPNFAVSPDGTRICFVAQQGGKRSLYVRALASETIQPIAGTEDPFHPFWSPDGRWIGFSARGKLWKTAASGTEIPQQICEVGSEGAVASWGGHTILLADRPGGRTEIYRVADSGGAAQKVTTLAKDQWRHGWPTMLPDGRHFLYLASKSESLERMVLLGTLDEPGTSVLLRNVSQVDLLDENHIAYVRDGNLLVQQFDLGKRGVQGEPTFIASDVSYFYLSARARFSAAGGVIIYRTDTTQGRLSVLSRDGHNRVLDDQGPFYNVRLSPDGKQIAVAVVERATGMGDIWIYGVARAVKDRFTNEPGFELNPVWAPDQRYLVYAEAPGGTLPHIVRREINGGEKRDVLPPGHFQFPDSFAPDGSSLYFNSLRPQNGEDVFRLDFATNAITPIVATSFYEAEAQMSPDNRRLAYVSDATGGSEIYLLAKGPSNQEEKIRLSIDGGTLPRWSRGGRELVFLNQKTSALMSITPRASDDWSEPVLTTIVTVPPTTTAYDVMPDGSAFVIAETIRRPGDALFHVVLGAGQR